MCLFQTSHFKSVDIDKAKITKSFFLIFILSTLFFLNLNPAFSASKIVLGSSCKTEKQRVNYSGKIFSCSKIGKKLIWIQDKSPRIPSLAPSPMPTPIASTFHISIPSDYREISDCKLSNGSFQKDVTLSFELNPFRVKPSRDIKGLIFPIDFPDLESKSDPIKDFSYVAKGVSNYYKDLSEGRVNINWTINPTYTRFNTEVSKLKLSGSDVSGFDDFFKNALERVKSAIELSKYDFVVFAPPLTTTRAQIAYGPASPGSEDKISATMLDGQSYEINPNFPWTTAHEIGHLMGLPDIYSFDFEEQATLGPSKQYKFMGVYDLMNWAGGVGTELTAWNRWLIGFVQDDQIKCLPDSSTVTLITPIETVGGIKGLVIPLSTTEALVLESRRALRYDSKLTSKSEGVLVYRINTKALSGYGPMRVVPRAGWQDGLFRDAPLKLKDKLATEGYLIEILESGQFGDVVKVTKI